eukprot:CAMPEP_0169309116 /NCGR_PEP_ID=MMETSP1017-20121227/2238_1 /TAXON_ID=342587 /ORGANISM="Karlodinium micrum, Strain CCMP2283" /LENGTH=60 /DNA_ID=CAMNT_0009402617 /DNA_START=304 /DNA_END=486 /DNA_ORIENTATION=-
MAGAVGAAASTTGDVMPGTKLPMAGVAGNPANPGTAASCTVAVVSGAASDIGGVTPGTDS